MVTYRTLYAVMVSRIGNPDRPSCGMNVAMLYAISVKAATIESWPLGTPRNESCCDTEY
jgi:hypothetical protein